MIEGIPWNCMSIHWPILLGGLRLKTFIFPLCIVFASGLSAQKTVWQPSAGHTQIPIWPGAAPDPQPVRGPEYTETSGNDFLPGGRPVVGVSDVKRPTIAVYSPKGKNTGAAVVVFPGGGYQTLASILKAPRFVTGWRREESRVCC
jgi:hypothetical protein